MTPCLTTDTLIQTSQPGISTHPKDNRATEKQMKKNDASGRINLSFSTITTSYADDYNRNNNQQ